jgi:isopentenyl-diphosphate delta-isomerase
MRTRSGKRFRGRRSMSDQEMLDIVDDNDRVIRSAPRRLVLDEYHIHRAVIFFVFDREGSVFVNQRSASKEIYPGYWSIAFGGHVLSGESYDAAAIREVQEETGLLDRPVQIGTFKKRTADERENVTAYAVTASFDPDLFPDEIEQGRFSTMAELNEMLGRFDFLPETTDLLTILVSYTSRQSAGTA